MQLARTALVIAAGLALLAGPSAAAEAEAFAPPHWPRNTAPIDWPTNPGSRL